MLLVGVVCFTEGYRTGKKVGAIGEDNYISHHMDSLVNTSMQRIKGYPHPSVYRNQGTITDSTGTHP